MQIIPAIDLKDNKCVRLTKGDDETSIIFNDDPKEQAIYFQEQGCRKIHIVDLDAAFGRPEVNLPSIKKIRNSISIPIQLGGGIRKTSDVNNYFDIGIENLIIGSMSTKDPEAVKLLSSKFKNQIYVSLDIKKDSVMVKGWKEESDLKIDDILKTYHKSDVRGYVMTDIMNDGMLNGLNIEFVKKISEKINLHNKQNKKIIIAGGLTNYKDLENLKNLSIDNLEGVISGKSFYVGNINLSKAQQILESDGQS